MMAPHDETIRLTVLDPHVPTAVGMCPLDWSTLERFIAARYGRRYVPDLNGADVTAADTDDVASSSWLSMILDVDRRTVHSRREASTMKLVTAERYADRLGVHPSDIWGAAYWAALPDDDLVPEERPRMLGRRLRRDAEYLARVRAS